MERLPDVPRTGHQYTGNFADGYTRQHNGDSIMNGSINYITVTNSVVNVTDSNSVPSQHDTLLHTRRLRESLEGIKSDTASMIVHRDDNSSIRSHFTDHCSKLSLRFSFDRELCSTAVYEKIWRSLFKRHVTEGRTKTKQLSDDCVERTREAAESVTIPERRLTDRQQRSQDIDRMLMKDSMRPWRGNHALLLGTSCEDRALVISRLRELHGYVYTPLDFINYKQLLFKDLVRHTKMLVNFVSEYDIRLGDRVDQGKLLDILGYNFSADSDALFDKELAAAVVALWEDPSIPTSLARELNHQIPESALYLVNDATRIVAENYEPTEEDILHMQSRSVYDFLSAEKQHKKNCVYRFTNIDSQHHIPKNLVSSFDSVTSIIFCVNIADYDQGLRANKLVQSIDYFDSVINQPCSWPQDISVVLLLTHMDEFREKLADSPLGEHFPDFRGGCDVKQAEEYVIGRFRQVNRKDLFLDHHTTHLVTLGDIELIFKEINGQYMWKILAGSGIL